MIRFGLIAIVLGLMSFLFAASDETKTTSTDKASTAQSESKSTGAKTLEEKKRLSHEEQIASMLKDHPFIDNPKGVLRKSKDFNELKGLPARVINLKETERAFTGELWNHKGKGTYICKKCNCPLYRSDSKFDSGCGWPSFDDEIAGTVTRVPDKDGFRIEIVCTNCGGHLGHVFLGEQFTIKNTRHCVNSASITFVPESEDLPKIIVSDESKKYFAKQKVDHRGSGEIKSESSKQVLGGSGEDKSEKPKGGSSD